MPTTYQFDTVHLRAFRVPKVFVNIPLIHPFEDQAKLLFTKRHPEEWKDIRVAEVFPGYNFVAEPLRMRRKRR
jgi:hypothetical protein